MLERKIGKTLMRTDCSQAAALRLQPSRPSLPGSSSLSSPPRWSSLITPYFQTTLFFLYFFLFLSSPSCCRSLCLSFIFVSFQHSCCRPTIFLLSSCFFLFLSSIAAAAQLFSFFLLVSFCFFLAQLLPPSYLSSLFKTLFHVSSLKFF